jgi:hypothetical protein
MRCFALLCHQHLMAKRNKVKRGAGFSLTEEEKMLAFARIC